VRTTYNTSDTVTVTGLSPGDTAPVYASSKSTELLGSAAADFEGTAEIILDGRNPFANGGKIYVIRENVRRE
jgi:hypothetical protein